jgi:hypothetical protein
MQLISAAIVAGLLGRYLHNLHEGGGFNSRRVIYAISIAGIAIFFSLLFMLPLKYQFYAFPFDFIMFILWMIAFGLLINVSLLLYPTLVLIWFIKLTYMNSLEAQAVTRAGTEPAGVGHGEDGIDNRQGHLIALRALDVAAGEQLLHGVSSEASSGFSASYW